MVANAPGGSGGFSQSSDAAGPTAGYDPVMKKRQIKMPPGSRKKWLDHLRGKKVFSQDSKVAVLESKLNIYEDLSREMLTKLEAAVEKISEGNNRIAQILTKHDERIAQSMKTDTLIIKMIDELKKKVRKIIKLFTKELIDCR